MNRIAIVVQRCHESVVGGSETLAWQYAALLRDAYAVEVLTTTAVDANLWTNALPEGAEERGGVAVRRFHVDVGGSSYRSELFERLHEDFPDGATARRQKRAGGAAAKWTLALQEEFIKHIGPYSKGLLKFLRENWSDYKTIIFLTYLYPPTYFGLLEVPPDFALFAPTLHDEPPAYLPAYKHAARRARAMVWLTEAERRLGVDLWGDLPGHVVGASIDAAPRRPAPNEKPYLLYCGRVDPNKGCGEMFDHFIRFKAEHPSELRLILTGKDDIAIPIHPDIEFRGFVSAEEKFSLMAGANLFVMPSGNESLSIVTLEAMAQRTPVLASAVCPVLVDHINGSGAGDLYHDYQSFAAALTKMLSDEGGLLSAMGEMGSRYVKSKYTIELIRSALIEAIEARGRADAGARFPPAPAPPRLERAEVPIQFGMWRDQTRLAHRPGARPLPVPPGWTEDELRELVASVRVEDGPPEEMRDYATHDFKRFVYTLGLVPERSGLTILELGANPYFTTTLLRTFRDADLHLANYFGGDAGGGTQRVAVHRTGEELVCEYQHFNVERDEFPYEDASFDVVLFCEIVEHLVENPVRALLEIKRILKPGGVLILTTPNVARLDNVRRVIAGENIYDPYSGYGLYGRHNREYTTRELGDLLAANNFRVDTMFTADVHQDDAGSSLPSVAQVREMVEARRADTGQYIFCRAVAESAAERATERAAGVRPAWLYRSFHQDPGVEAE